MSDGSPSALGQLTLWRVREFLREPEAVFWVFAFPVLLAFALGIAFKNRGPDPVSVAVLDGPGAPAVQQALAADPTVVVAVIDSAEASNRLRTGRVSLVVLPGSPVGIRFDSTRSESRVARLVVIDALQNAAGRRDVAEIREQRVNEVGSRYIDFLIPGLLGMNIMGTGMWGIGFAVVKARSGKLLKRFLASPMSKSQYLFSHILARLVFLALEVGSVLLFAWLVFRVPVRGSLLAITLVVLLGAMAFSGMNLVMVPMWIFSGVFFSSANFPDAVQPLIKALPLTALNNAIRGVMIDGSSLVQMLPFLAIVAVWGVLSFGVALKLFRWR